MPVSDPLILWSSNFTITLGFMVDTFAGGLGSHYGNRAGRRNVEGCRVKDFPIKWIKRCLPFVAREWNVNLTKFVFVIAKVTTCVDLSFKIPAGKDMWRRWKDWCRCVLCLLFVRSHAETLSHCFDFSVR
jgi:hypothetical protein